MKRTARQYAQALLTACHDASPKQRQDVVRRFRAMLRRHRATKLLHRILSHVEKLDRESRKKTLVRVETAVSSDEASVNKRLAHVLGRDVEVVHELNKKLLGGAIVTVGDKQVDGSIARMLMELNDRLASSDHSRISHQT